MTDEEKVLRDQFAMNCSIEEYGVSSALEQHHGRQPTIAEVANFIALIRYLEADAMMKQRSDGLRTDDGSDDPYDVSEKGDS